MTSASVQTRRVEPPLAPTPSLTSAPPLTSPSPLTSTAPPPEPTQDRPVASGRLAGLDGLRGLAAGVVVVHHSLLCVAVLASAYATPSARLHGTAAWLAYSPLHMLWDGQAAVFVFFLLSGFVLVLPALRGTWTWEGYFVKRLIRLYLPAWAALAGAFVLTQLVPRRPVPGGTDWWLNGHGYTPSLTQALSDAELVTSASWLNSVVWTLRWEVVFSLTLPLFIIVAATHRRWWLGKVVVLLAASGLGAATHHDSLLYLPMFAIGATFAVERDALVSAVTGLWSGRRAVRRAGRRGAAERVAVPTAVGLLAVGLVSARWVVRLSESDPGATLTGVLTAAAVLGAALLLVLTIAHPGVAGACSAPPVRWLGSRSFSLYLVHEPLVVEIGLHLPPDRAWWVLPLGAPLALGVAEVFYRLVERPSHRLAQRAGRALAGPRAAHRMPTPAAPRVIVLPETPCQDDVRDHGLPRRRPVGGGTFAASGPATGPGGHARAAATRAR